LCHPWAGLHAHEIAPNRLAVSLTPSALFKPRFVQLLSAAFTAPPATAATPLALAIALFTTLLDPLFGAFLRMVAMLFVGPGVTAASFATPIALLFRCLVFIPAVWLPRCSRRRRRWNRHCVADLGLAH
jgi:hypothetical protein